LSDCRPAADPPVVVEQVPGRGEFAARRRDVAGSAAILVRRGEGGRRKLSVDDPLTPTEVELIQLVWSVATLRQSVMTPPTQMLTAARHHEYNAVIWTQMGEIRIPVELEQLYF